MVEDGEWKDCLWEPADARLLVRGLVKCLIQARWRAEPRFLPADQVNAWFPPNGAELSGTDRSTQTLLGHAATNARRLQAIGFLPDVWHTSATLVPGPAVARELTSAVHGLLSGDVANDNPVAALSAATRRAERPADWMRVIDWDVLPQLLPLLDQFPKPKPRPPAVVPYWDKDAGVLKYGRWVARRINAVAEKIRTLLDKFEADGWPTRIRSPKGWGAPDVHETLRRLRDGLTHITFRSERGGTEVCWAPVPKKARGSNRKA